jgi:hypothetical protein
MNFELNSKVSVIVGDSCSEYSGMRHCVYIHPSAHGKSPGAGDDDMTPRR